MEFLQNSQGILIRKLLIHFENDRKSPTNIPIRKLDDYGILMKF